MARAQKRHLPPLSFHFRETIVVDGYQKLFLEVPVHYEKTRGYITAVSKNALSGAPIVIGPLDLPKTKWLALSAYAKEIAGLVKEPPDDERHRKSIDGAVLY